LDPQPNNYHRRPVKEISWNGRDDFGNKIGKGVYIYKLTVKSNLTDKGENRKLVIL
jgi:hypothetical protein